MPLSCRTTSEGSIPALNAREMSLAMLSVNAYMSVPARPIWQNISNGRFSYMFSVAHSVPEGVAMRLVIPLSVSGRSMGRSLPQSVGSTVYGFFPLGVGASTTVAASPVPAAAAAPAAAATVHGSPAAPWADLAFTEMTSVSRLPERYTVRPCTRAYGPG